MTEGGCFCGDVRYRVEGSPRRVTHCHCLHCRRTSGAVFLTWAEFDAAQFRFTKGRPGLCESRPGVTRQFCTGCGTQLTFQDAENADAMDVTVASLDDPGVMKAEDHVWCDRMMPWLEMNDGLPRYALGRHAKRSE